MYASVTSVLLNLVLGYVLISNFGYLAAGYSTLICYFIQATLDYFALKRVVKENVYNMKFIGVLSAAVVFIALFSNMLYEFVLIRYLIVLAFVVLAIFFRKKIITMIKTIKSK